MIIARAAFLASLLVLPIGCTSLPSRLDNARDVIQKSLDAVLPPSFEGDTYFTTRNSYVSIGVTLRAGGLRRTASGWEWKWLVYSGDSPMSHTTFVFGAPPVSLLP